MIAKAIKTPIDQDAQQLLLPLLYFDIFRYPLKVEEIKKFSKSSLSLHGAVRVLNHLVENKILFRIEDYFLMHPDQEAVRIRKENNDRAIPFLAKAKSMTHLISLFPFVKAVFISGSLSKGVMPIDGDIDFFIITSQDRLWICRSLLILFKKIFLFNSHKYFCLNYFVDESSLKIEDQNTYTAVEIGTLIPVYGASMYKRFIKNNLWIRQYLPQMDLNEYTEICETRSLLIHYPFDFIVKGAFGRKLNHFLMNLTLRFWKTKYTSFDSNYFLQAFKSTPHVSKHHPNNFQSKVLHALTARIHSFEHDHQIKFDASSL